MNLVLLVHGTWARGAEWCKEGSEIQNALSKRLDPRHFKIVPSFEWTDRNRFRARHFATTRLKAAISKYSEQFENIYIIGHSHGGTIAAKAADSASATNVHVLSFGTPYLNVKRNILGLLYLATTFLIFMVGVTSIVLFILMHVGMSKIVVLFGIALGNLGWLQYAIGIPLLAAISLIMIGLLIFSIAYTQDYAYEIWDKIKHLGERTRDRRVTLSSNLRGLNPNQTICYYSTLDEVYVAMKLTRSISIIINILIIFSIGYVFYASGSAYKEFNLRAFKFLFGEFLYLELLNVNYSACKICPDKNQTDLEIQKIGMLFYALIPASTLALKALFNYTVVKAAFGIHDLPLAFSSAISASRGPVAHKGAVELVRVKTRAWRRLKLAHSVLVNDEVVAHDAATWIKRHSAKDGSLFR